jgi:hypothetical protein
MMQESSNAKLLAEQPASVLPVFKTTSSSGGASVRVDTACGMIPCVSDDEPGLLLDNSEKTKEDVDQLGKSEVQFQDRQKSKPY